MTVTELSAVDAKIDKIVNVAIADLIVLCLRLGFGYGARRRI